MFKSILLCLIDLYQRFLSPLFSPACRFYPSCSEYSKESIVRYGILKGCFLSAIRISKCHPFHSGGFDPVP